MKTPIALIPFHDWRKIMLEGFRTRDAHFIEEFSKEKDRIKIIINLILRYSLFVFRWVANL